MLAASLINSENEWSNFFQSLAQTIFVGAILGLVYETLLRHDIVNIFEDGNRELISASKTLSRQFNLSEQASSIGLIGVYPSEGAFDYSAVINEARELTFIFNDGRTWFSRHEADLSERLSKENRTTSVILVHPESKFLQSLSRKVDSEIETLKQKTKETEKMLKRCLNSNHRLRITGHHFPSSYSAVITETIAIYIPYPMARKEDRIPCFIYTSAVDGSYYYNIKRDVDALELRASELLFDSEIHDLIDSSQHLLPGINSQ